MADSERAENTIAWRAEPGSSPSSPSLDLLVRRYHHVRIVAQEILRVVIRGCYLG
jgi:hypothetical protein